MYIHIHIYIHICIGLSLYPCLLYTLGIQVRNTCRIWGLKYLNNTYVLGAIWSPRDICPIRRCLGSDSRDSDGPDVKEARSSLVTAWATALIPGSHGISEPLCPPEASNLVLSCVLLHLSGYHRFGLQVAQSRYHL